MKRTLVSAAMMSIALHACAPESPPTDQDPAQPWALESVSPDVADGVRILVLHDMEGLSGQDDPSSFDFGTPEYPFGQELLAADINAVIDGLFRGGATEVHVVDGHGSGNPDPDVRSDLLDSRATQVLRDEAFDTYFDMVEDGVYDGVAVVGMHAKTGSGGFASHTFTLGIGIVVNGQEITETELVALSWGRVGVPVIFGSGDDRLASDLTTMPWLEFVTVKTAIGADSAALRPVDEARADLTAGAERAVQNLLAGGTRSMRATSPLDIGVRAVPPANIAPLEGLPGLAFADSTATYTVDSIRHGYDVVLALVRNATRGYAIQLSRSAREEANGEEIMRRFNRYVTETWFDYESGRWQSPDARSIEDPGPPRQYHGYR